MHLLTTSTPERPNKVKILFYRQSITRQDYSRKIIEVKLREQFPHAQLDVLNPAIGGYTAPKSVHTMYQTLIPQQPDLVVFHVYDGEENGSYEQIVRNIREHTKAELVEVTHHLDAFYDRDDARDKASRHRMEIAKKYGSELVEVRKHWRQYLDMHNLNVEDFLGDKIHLNRHGGELWGALQARHFEKQPADPKDWETRVSRIDPKLAKESVLGEIRFDRKEWKSGKDGISTTQAGAKFTLDFTGTRVDVISWGGDGVADILVDGKPPSAHLGTWAATLPSPTPIDYRPGIMRVGIAGKPVAETWTVTAHEISVDGKEFSYSLRGSESGYQGCGDHKTDFQSTNGMIHLQPRMFRFAEASWIRKKPVPTPCEIRWDIYNTSLDAWECKGATKENPSGQVTLVQQLENQLHTLEIIPRQGTVEIGEILIYRPDAVENANLLP